MHFETVLDLGYDYGADGGQAWDTQVIPFPNGKTRRNQRRSVPLGTWQLGNRNVDATALAYLRGFVHAMRGSAHSFLFKDWTDYQVTNEALDIDGTDETQLTKTYGSSINSWVRDIAKPDADTVVIQYDQGSGFVSLTADTDYTLDDTTGKVTWLMDYLPDSPNSMRWSGKLYVPARFDRDLITAQFLGIEERTAGDEVAYAIGALSVIEEPGV